MNPRFWLIVPFFLLLLSACEEEPQPCIAPSATENIVGTWDLTLSAVEVTFQADGTLDDPNDGIIGAEVNGVVYDQKTYVVVADTLSATARPSSGPGEVSADFLISQNECDEIKISIAGLSIEETLTRK